MGGKRGETPSLIGMQFGEDETQANSKFVEVRNKEEVFKEMKTWADARGNIKSISEEEKFEIEVTADLIAQLINKRTELGLSQRQLSCKSGIKQAAIARLEKFNVVPRIDTLARLSKSLGMEIKLVSTKS